MRDRSGSWKDIYELFDDIRCHIDEHDSEAKMLLADSPTRLLMGWACDSCREMWQIQVRQVRDTADPDLKMLLNNSLCRQYIGAALSTDDSSVDEDPNEIIFADSHDLSEITDEQRTAMGRILNRSLEMAKTRRIIED